MITLALLGIISIGSIGIGLKVIDKRLDNMSKELKRVNNKSINNSFSIKDVEITQRQILEFQKEQFYEIDKLYQYQLNTREIMQDKVEEIKSNVSKNRKDLQWAYINNPVKVVVLDGESKK